jgi:hypothetical protein
VSETQFPTEPVGTTILAAGRFQAARIIELDLLNSSPLAADERDEGVAY